MPSSRKLRASSSPDSRKEAYDQRNALIEEVKKIFADPLSFLTAIKDEYVQKFEKFVELSAKDDLTSQYEAGKIFGSLFLEIVGLILSGVAVVKAAAKLPQLFKWAGRLKGKLPGLTKKALGAADDLPPPKKVGPIDTPKADAPPAKLPSKGTKLTYDPVKKTWKSPAGLEYGEGSVHGNRVKHVLDHAKPNPAKQVHSVFNANKNEVLGVLDEAWLKRGAPVPGDPGAYVVPMGRAIGTAGETSVKIIVKPGTTQVITAFPFK